MFHSAASYIWGSSNTDTNDTTIETNNNLDRRLSNSNINTNNDNINTSTISHFSQFTAINDNTDNSINDNTTITNKWRLPNTSLIKRFIPNAIHPTSNSSKIKLEIMHKNKNTHALNPTDDHKTPIDDIPITAPSIPSKDQRFKYRLAATDNIAFMFENDSHSHHIPQSKPPPIPMPTYTAVATPKPATVTSLVPAIEVNKSRYNLPYLISSNRAKGESLYDTYPYLKSPEYVPQCLVTSENVSENAGSEKAQFAIKNLSKQQRIAYFINGLPGLTDKEREGIHSLFLYIKNDRLAYKLRYDLLLGEIILIYFSSYSPTNPDPIGCWKKWIVYRLDIHNSSIAKVESKDLYAFFKSGVYNIGFDCEQRPVWFFITENYSHEFSPEINTKATIMWLCSMMWNLRTNEFDLFSLRKGIVGFCNLSHFSLSAISIAWSEVKMVKHAIISIPFFNSKIFSVNTPTLIYLARNLATKILVPHAMEKWTDLSDMGMYFESYASRHQTPVDMGGTLKVTALQWITDRGYLDYVQ